MTRIMQQMREGTRASQLCREHDAFLFRNGREDFRRYRQKRLDHMEPADIRRYQVHLLEERKLGVGTVIKVRYTMLPIRPEKKQQIA